MKSYRYQKGWETIINKSYLIGGDIMLCYSESLSEKMYISTNSRYNHTAIYIGNNLIAEATVKGIKKNNIDEISNDYDHFAIIRQKDCWSNERIANLNFFIDDRIAFNAQFNSNGIREFSTIKDEHQIHQTQKIIEYFDGTRDPVDPIKDKYFCSELIASIYITVGIIDNSASLAYDPKTFSPGDIGKDPTFGSFVGYIINKTDYAIPENDDFYHEIMDIVLPE